jgi:hypothetical protein
MTTITVPDDMAIAVERFIAVLKKTNMHKRTMGSWLKEELLWVEQEQRSLAERSLKDPSGATVTVKLRILLELTGEAFIGPSGLEVSSRVLSWCLNALAKQEGMTTDEARVILDSKPDGDRFWWFMQLLDDAALNALVQILEKERKK